MLLLVTQYVYFIPFVRVYTSVDPSEYGDYSGSKVTSSRAAVRFSSPPITVFITIINEGKARLKILTCESLV
jgi:hypothetical protein